MAEEKFNPRKYMEMAVRVMKKSVHEPRKDKASPFVGAVLIKPDGSVESAFRGEYRYGDHAEFTLLDRKNRNEILDGSLLFATLEPCAPKSRNLPKLSCSERIVNARIKKVWIGIEDPDPKVDRKGIQHLLDHNIEVEMFDRDLQREIREVNKEFIFQAEDRAKKAEEERTTVLSSKEKAETKARLDDLSEMELKQFIDYSDLNVQVGTDNFIHIMFQLGILEKDNGAIVPTGIGLLLFGNKPQLIYPNALIRATYKTRGKSEDIETIEGSLLNQVGQIQSWYEKNIGKQISRDQAERKTVYDYPLVVFREAIINAIVHRDYDIEGAPIYFEINDDAIIIKSPGAPVPPLKLEQIKQFNAPSLSRNPKIMYVFDQLKLVEQRGLGFQTIKELQDKFDLPLPLVSFENPYMVFKFPRSAKAIKSIAPESRLSKLNKEELAGYNYIRVTGKITRKEYEKHFSFDKKKAERHLKRLTELGLIVRKGAGPSTYYEYIATEEG
ncbi:MAG: ATP-binding protein [bacterium]